MRLIDADAVKKMIHAKWTSGSLIVRMWDEIDKLPTVEAEPVKHGRWWFEEYPDGYYNWECSHCRKQYSEDTMEAGKEYSYCPNCGAKMDGGGDGER